MATCRVGIAKKERLDIWYAGVNSRVVLVISNEITIPINDCGEHFTFGNDTGTIYFAFACESEIGFVL